MKMEIDMPGIDGFSVNRIEDEQSLLRFRIRKLLQTNIVEINFVKKDGTNRKMVCTLDPMRFPGSVLEELERDKEWRTVSNDVLPVWDMEKNAWRSFRIDSVVDFIALKGDV